MSPNLIPVEPAHNLDWNIVATAAAVFIATLITTIWGWFEGKKRLARKYSPENYVGSSMIAGAVLQDNQTLRESTVAARELRDQFLLNTDAMRQMHRRLDDTTDALRDLADELKRQRIRDERQDTVDK